MQNRQSTRDLKKMYFDSDVAKEVGVDEAIMFQNLKFWCNLNERKKSEMHFHEGVYWTFNSVTDFEKIFSFWTFSQIRRILKNLIKREYIRKDSFNKCGYDKKSWYSIIKATANIDEPSDDIDLVDWL